MIYTCIENWNISNSKKFTPLIKKYQASWSTYWATKFIEVKIQSNDMLVTSS